MVSRYPSGMRKNPTSPVVITDTNGKTTTVHRRSAPVSGRVIPTLPTVSVSNRQASLQAEILSLRDGLSDRSKKSGQGVLGSYTKMAYRAEDVVTLRALDRFADGQRNPGHIVGAIAALRNNQKDPEEWLNEGNIDIACNVREQVAEWLGNRILERNVSQGYDVDKTFEEILMFVLEDPSREAMVVHAIRDLNIGDLDEIKKLDMSTPTPLVDGAL